MRCDWVEMTRLNGNLKQGCQTNFLNSRDDAKFRAAEPGYGIKTS